MNEIFDTLFRTIQARKQGDPAASYTAKLFSKGRAKIAQKMGEEAVELAIAAVTDQHAGMVSESADLLFHLLVLWAEAGVTPEEVFTELKKREGQSGLEEKASRT